MVLSQELYVAVKEGNLPEVQRIMEWNADINKNKNYLLSVASKHGHLEIVKLLFVNGADIRDQQNNALYWAVHNGHFEVVKFFVENGVDFRFQDDFMLQTAVENGYLQIVEYLVGKGASIYSNNNELARRSAERGHFDIAKFLIEAEFREMHYYNPSKLFSIFEQAAICFNEEMANYCIERGIDVNYFKGVRLSNFDCDSIQRAKRQTKYNSMSVPNDEILRRANSSCITSKRYLREMW